MTRKLSRCAAQFSTSRRWWGSLAAAALGAGLLVAGCKSAPKKATEGPIGTLSAGSFKVGWAAVLDVANDTPDQLFVFDDSLIAYTPNHLAFSVNRASGQIRHVDRVMERQNVLRPPVVLTDKIVYPTNNTLEVFDKAGKRIRSIPLEGTSGGGASGAGNTVYFGIDDPHGGRLLAVDVTAPYGTGTKWRLQTFGPISSAPAVFQGVVYAGSEDGRIYAVNAETRDAVWSLEGGVFLTAGRIVGAVKADEFGVFFSSTDSKLYCVDRSTGKVKWQYFGGEPLDQGPVVTATSVYQYAPGKGVAAIEKNNKAHDVKPKWVAADCRQLLAEDDRNAYLRTRNNAIVAVDRNTGERKFTSQRTDLKVFGTNPKDGTVFVIAEGGRLMAVTPVLKAGQMGEVVMVGFEETVVGEE